MALFVTKEQYELLKDTPDFKKRSAGHEIKFIPSNGSSKPTPASTGWAKVKSFWEAASSRGLLATVAHATGISDTLGARVPDEVFKIRLASCLSCNQLKTTDGLKWCGACGCGKNKLAVISDVNNPESFSKLSYPELQCPLARPGFSNSEELSIIMPVLNDENEANETVKSIRATSPTHIEIIAVDDGSEKPLAITDPTVKVIRNQNRIGAGAARHLGATQAKFKHLLFIDSHMRFTPGWFENAMQRVVPNPKTLWCAACLGLDATNMDVNKPAGVYTGAKLVLLEFDQYNKANVFDAQWQPEQPGDDYEIGSVMGACYFVHKDWFFHIGGLESNRMYGSEEPAISVKTWLAGGEVRLMKSVRVGHKFRDHSPYSTLTADIIYNRLRPMKTMFPDNVFQFLTSKMPKDVDHQLAFKRLADESESVETERALYQQIFVHDLDWLCQKFSLPQPWKLTRTPINSQVS